MCAWSKYCPPRPIIAFPGFWRPQKAPPHPHRHSQKLPWLTKHQAPSCFSFFLLPHAGSTEVLRPARPIQGVWWCLLMSRPCLWQPLLMSKPTPLATPFYLNRCCLRSFGLGATHVEMEPACPLQRWWLWLHLGLGSCSRHLCKGQPVSLFTLCGSEARRPQQQQLILWWWWGTPTVPFEASGGLGRQRWWW